MPRSEWDNLPIYAAAVPLEHRLGRWRQRETKGWTYYRRVDTDRGPVLRRARVHFEAET